MKKHLLTVFIAILIASTVISAYAETTTNIRADDSLSVTFEFRNLDEAVYEQAKTQFAVDTIPKIIASNLEKGNQSVRWGLPATPLTFENANRTIRNSFFLGGSALATFTVNKTELKRMYEVKTDWRKFKVNLTGSFSVDFAQHAAKPVAEWQKLNATTFYFENRGTGAGDIVFYLVLPASASRVRGSGDTVFYDVPPYLEDQLLYSPFPVLGALAVALAIILLYRKIR
ncbi:MAG TPA: hypothetical protein VJ249_10825 [Candidatus Bathyarchaeia archaeon]|nr:hypothetical protein [Candidatus Bathyarchaeia archaeon]